MKIPRGEAQGFRSRLLTTKKNTHIQYQCSWNKENTREAKPRVGTSTTDDKEIFIPGVHSS